MKHPWDKDKKQEKPKYKEYDMYQMITGFKADKKKKKYVYERDRYGAKARKRALEEKQLKQE